MPQKFHIKRVYDDASNQDGYRVLVDRIWPRGIAKEPAVFDLWLREIAPSAGLRKWFGHKPERWTEFKQRYYRELRDEAGHAAVNRLRAIKSNIVTLLFAAKDVEHNNAAALQEYLSERGSLSER